MKYQDKIYGEIEIEEPAILELIAGKSMQRLKGIDQHGYYEIYLPYSSVSRFEHSVGVFILLKRFNASLLEQIAGLLHDVSHTAFSHVADYVFHDGSGEYKNFQDEELEGFIKKSEIPAILKKYNIDYNSILDESKFPLQEKDLPDLCADRIDYFLRDALAFKKASKEEISSFLNDLIVVKNLWVFKNKEIAKKYAYLFLEVNNLYWSGPESATMLQNMGELIKYCLNKKIIFKNDLFKTDKEVWAKIRPEAKKDERLKFLLDRADNKYNYITNSKNDYDLYALNKSRVVDPLFLEGKRLVRVSKIDKNLVKLKKEFSKPKEYYIKFLEKRSAGSSTGLK